MGIGDWGHIGGGGGTVVDHWSAHFAHDIQYLYRLKENIQTGKEMEKEKNMIIMVTYNSKVNI